MPFVLKVEYNGRSDELDARIESAIGTFSTGSGYNLNTWARDLYFEFDDSKGAINAFLAVCKLPVTCVRITKRSDSSGLEDLEF